MGIQYWTHDIVIVDLPEEPQISDELDGVAEIVSAGRGCAVVLDFSEVDIVTSSSLSKLLELQRLVANAGRRIILCCLDTAIEGILKAANLEGCFELADERFIALTTIEMIG
ncbi:MAG: STAS domain-containing protein [Sedimentisphaerales bacterium]|nr:STAS domain-containing protein [Sedimentisphaerales bacterium]